MSSIFAKPQVWGMVRYISHRGFQPMAPANSIPAFEYAGLFRQWAIETDVHATRDGILVCCHDEQVDRLFDGQGAIREMDWQDLSRLRMNQGNRLSCLSDEEKRMPLFSEYLAICKKFGSIPFIELKTGDVGPVLVQIRRSGLSEEEVVMSSSNLDWLLETRKQAKNMFLHWIFGNEERLGELARAGNAGMSWKIDDPMSEPKELIALSHSAGLKVCLRAADSPAVAQRMLRLELDYLPTNCMHNPF